MGVAGADALDDCDCLWLFVVAGALDVTFGGARCVYQALKLKTCDYVGVVSTSIFSVEFCPVDKIVASGKDYGAECFGSGAIGVVVADCTGGADFCAHTAFVLGEFPAGVGIDGRLAGNSLGEWLVNGLAQR